MPRESYPRDRFDELADEPGRVGAHRAENPRLRPGIVALWAVIATVLLTVIGIFGALVISERIVLFPEPVPTVAAPAVVDPVVDPSYSVLVLNASGQAGLATQAAETIIAAGWAADAVNPGDAGASFEVTTVFYVNPEDEAAALGLAGVIGGAEVAQSSQYVQEDDPATERNEARMLTVVLGTDRVTPPATPAS